MTTIDRYSGLAPNLGRKAPARVATTTNVTLAGLQTINGVTLVEDDRVIVWQQTHAYENGIYDASSGNWTRSIDFNSLGDFVLGTSILAAAGTANALVEFTVTAKPAVLDINTLSFQVSSTQGVVTEGDIREVTITTDVPLTTDNGGVVKGNNAGGITVTVPTGMPEGYTVTYWQTGTGQIVRTAGAGVSFIPTAYDRTAYQGAAMTLFHFGSDVYGVTGQIA
jgi:hypothetical protein